MKPRGTYGLMAEFNSATELVEASRKTYAEGYRKIDGYSPFPIHELDEALGITRSKLPWIIFLGGLFAYWLLRRFDLGATAALIGCAVEHLSVISGRSRDGVPSRSEG